MKTTSKHCIAVFLAASMVVLSVGKTQAMLAPVSTQSSYQARIEDKKTIQSFLELKEVRDHLSQMKLTSSDIESRLGNLSEQELHEVASRIEQQQPGRDGSGVVVTVLVIGILALLFVYLLKRV